ncbi:MAG: hypothetical protein PT119_22995 [Aphanizomenon gracile PMC627.10]|nr:hypothetical protein [Aphanizomenon gracile PMC627.10]
MGVEGCDSEALLQAVRCLGGLKGAIAVWELRGCDSEALLQAVRCLGG